LIPDQLHVSPFNLAIEQLERPARLRLNLSFRPGERAELFGIEQIS
jgi:hypothetical protein